MKITISILAIFLNLYSFCQEKKIQTINANSISVNIKVDGIIHKNAWSIMPHLRPDIYETNGRHVTFYTDCDSISFNISKKKPIDFVILLNGKDTALTQIKYNSFENNYLTTLKKGKKYNYSDKREVPKFTYQSMKDSNLVKLRMHFKLDSIAGEGNEISKLLNLMHWMHTAVPHDGQNGNPEIKNALSMIPLCKKENRGLNCRGLAIVLNECYLAMGFKSRFVTCLPKDSIVEECHVINTVYSYDLQKWIYLDPTHDAYVMDENGILLGISEVRERLITGGKMILNPNANWNNKVSSLKEDYINRYMAKNLYRLECPLKSEFDLETASKSKKYISLELLPLDGYNQNLESYENKEKDVFFINYKTNNPAVFWLKP